MESRKVDDGIARRVSSAVPPGPSSHLLGEPKSLREAQASPEWPQWQGALKREIDGQISGGISETVERPKGKTVLGTRIVFKRKLGKDGQVEKYKCRFVAQGIRQIKGLHCQESSSPTPA